MIEENQEPTDRTPLDYFQFGLASLGFFTGAGGVVISSICTVFVGLFLLALGMAYFLVPEE